MIKTFLTNLGKRKGYRKYFTKNVKNFRNAFGQSFVDVFFSSFRDFGQKWKKIDDVGSTLLKADLRDLKVNGKQFHFNYQSCIAY